MSLVEVDCKITELGPEYTRDDIKGMPGTHYLRDTIRELPKIKSTWHKIQRMFREKEPIELNGIKYKIDCCSLDRINEEISMCVIKIE